MAVDLSLQLFDAFLGSQEGIHSVILPDIFSSGGSQNVFIDKFARVAQINGYTKQNISAFTTDTGASAAMVRGLIPYRATGGGSVTRKLLIILDDQVNEWEIHVSTDQGASKSFLYDAGSGSVGTIPDAAQFGDNIYITNGKVQPRIYNGTTIAATGLTQSPTITATESSNSGNLKGNYRYKLVSTIAGVRQNGSAPSTSVLLADKQMSLSWTADANTSVDGYEIYRTTGTGTVYYWLTSIDGRTTVAYTDNTSDLTLLENRILEEHGDNPPVAYYCEPHKQRMWWLKTDTFPTRGYWSDPGAPESVYGENFLDFSDSETVGDQITGAFGNYEGLLVVFTERAIWSVSGTGQVIGDIVDWTKTHTNAQIGSVSSRSAVRIPAGSKYSDQNGQLQVTSVSSLAYFTPLGDIRVFDGENDLIVSHPVRDTVKAFNYTHRAKVWAMIDSDNDQAIWCFPSTNVTEPDTMVVWNYRYGVWYKWTPMPFGHGCELDTSSDAALLLVGQDSTSTGGFVYAFLSGNSFDGANIDARWMTKTLFGIDDQTKPAFSHTKRWRWLDVMFKITSDVAVTVEWLSGDSPDTASAIGSVDVSSDASPIFSQGGFFRVRTASLTDILCAAASAQTRALLQTSSGDYLHDEGIRLRFRTNAVSGPWYLEGMQLAYQKLQGLKRRDQ